MNANSPLVKAALYLGAGASAVAVVIAGLFGMQWFDQYYLGMGFERDAELLSMSLLSNLAVLAVFGGICGWCCLKLYAAHLQAKGQSQPAGE